MTKKINISLIKDIAIVILIMIVLSFIIKSITSCETSEKIEIIKCRLVGPETYEC